MNASWSLVAPSSSGEPIMPVRKPLLPSLALSLLLAGVFLASVVSVSSQSEAPGETTDNESLVEFTAYPDTGTIEPGKTFTLLFHARMKPDWHIYWENPGETGMETQISIDAPNGFSTGSIRWPRPITFQTGGLTTYGYGKETVLFVPVTAPETLSGGPYTFTAKITSLACREKCVMQRQEVSVTLPSDGPPSGDLKQTVDRHRAAVPEAFSELDGASVTWDDGDVVFKGPRDGMNELTFFPVAVSGVELGSPSVSLDASTFTLRVPVEWHPENYLGNETPAVKGVIALGSDPFGPSYRVSIPLERRKN